MKKLLSLFILMLAFNVFPSEENVTTLCNMRRVGRGFVRSVNTSFDFVKCIRRGLDVYSEGKLAVAKNTCLSFEKHAVGRNATLECMELINVMKIPDDGPFIVALSECSKIEKEMLSLTKRQEAMNPESLARLSVYVCMKNMF